MYNKLSKGSHVHGKFPKLHNKVLYQIQFRGKYKQFASPTISKRTTFLLGPCFDLHDHFRGQEGFENDSEPYGSVLF